MLLDGTGASSRERCVLHVRDGRIEAIADDDGAEPTIDLAAVTVVPGLVDAHVHLCFSAEPGWDPAGEPDEAVLGRARANAGDLLASGVTAAGDCGGRTDILVRLRGELARGELAGPRLAISGSFLTRAGEHGSNLDGRVVGDLADAARAVDEAAAAGVDFVKVMATGGGGDGAATVLFDAPTLGAIVERARGHGLRVAAHAHGPAGIANAIAAGVDRIEHCTFFDGETCAVEEALARDAAARGILVCPTNAIDYRRIEQGGPGAPREELIRAWRTLVACDVELAGGSDAGVTDMRFDDYALVPELMVSELGLTPLEALMACAHRAAEAIGLGGEVGTLEPGKWADLLAVEGDPSVDVSALRRVAAVIQGGRIIHVSTPPEGVRA